MPKKIKLDLEKLSVNSFKTTSDLNSNKGGYLTKVCQNTYGGDCTDFPSDTCTYGIECITDNRC